MVVEEISRLEGIAATLIGFVGVALGLVFGSDLAVKHWNAVSTLGIGLSILATVAFAAAIYPRRKRFDPAMAALIATAGSGSTKQVGARMTRAIAESVSANQRLLAWKVRAVRIGTAAVVSGLAITGVRLVSLATS